MAWTSAGSSGRWRRGERHARSRPAQPCVHDQLVFPAAGCSRCDLAVALVVRFCEDHGIALLQQIRFCTMLRLGRWTVPLGPMWPFPFGIEQHVVGVAGDDEGLRATDPFTGCTARCCDARRVSSAGLCPVIQNSCRNRPSAQKSWCRTARQRPGGRDVVIEEAAVIRRIQIGRNCCRAACRDEFMPSGTLTSA